jgi:hypothetical protein
VWAAVIEAAARRFTDATTSRVLSFGLGIELLTGHGRTGYSNATGVGFAPLAVLFRRIEWLEQHLAEATGSGRMIVLGGSDGKWSTPKVVGIRPRHCYSVLDYHPDARQVRVRDPWGRDDAIPTDRKRDGYGPGEFWLSTEELEGSFVGLTIED